MTDVRKPEYVDTIKSTLMAMAGQQNVIVVNRAFVDFAGSLEAGLLLSQLLYWTPRARIEGGWIAKTNAEFQDELCISYYSLKKASRGLIEQGVLETKIVKFNGQPTVHYRLDLDALIEKWRDRYREIAIRSRETARGSRENAKSLTEITTETTQGDTSDADYKNKVASILAGEHDEERELALAQHQARVFAAVQSGHRKNEDARDAVVRLFGVTPNWSTKTNTKFLHWLAERDEGETLDRFAIWWYDNDWRGKKGQPPTMNQIQENWRRAFDGVLEERQRLDDMYPLMGSAG